MTSLFYTKGADGRKHPSVWVYLFLAATFLAGCAGIIMSQPQTVKPNVPSHKVVREQALYLVDVESTNPEKLFQTIRLPIERKEGRSYRVRITISDVPDGAPIIAEIPERKHTDLDEESYGQCPPVKLDKINGGPDKKTGTQSARELLQ